MDPIGVKLSSQSRWRVLLSDKTNMVRKMGYVSLSWSGRMRLYPPETQTIAPAIAPVRSWIFFAGPGKYSSLEFRPY